MQLLSLVPCGMVQRGTVRVLRWAPIPRTGGHQPKYWTGVLFLTGVCVFGNAVEFVFCVSLEGLCGYGRALLPAVFVGRNVLKLAFVTAVHFLFEGFAGVRVPLRFCALTVFRARLNFAVDLPFAVKACQVQAIAVSCASWPCMTSPSSRHNPHPSVVNVNFTRSGRRSRSCSARCW